MSHLPTATLRIECAAINPPKPLGVGVFADGKMIAVVELNELKCASSELEAIISARSGAECSA